MATVAARKEESLDSLMRRFRRKIEKEGLMDEMQKRRFYKSPSVKKREKHEAALKRAAKAARKFQAAEESLKKGK